MTRLGCNRYRDLPLRVTSMDVTEWLRGLGLQQYVPAFLDNDIDGEVLCGLTADDLRELGVASIGHRRRLLDAIARLVDGQPSAEASPAPSAAVVSSEAEPAADRDVLRPGGFDRALRTARP